MRKIILCIIIIIDVLVLGGCEMIETTNDNKNRNSKVKEEMIAYIEKKYDLDFKLDDIEFATSIYGTGDDRGYFIPENNSDIVVTVTRKENNGKVSISDDYQTYLYWNEAFDYFNHDIQLLYPNTITFPYLKFNDHIAINKSFDECLETATYKLLLQLYIDESSGPNEDIIQKLDQLANQYYEKFNHNKIELNIFFLSNKGLIEMKEIDNSLTDASYYLRFKKTNELLGSPNYPNIKPTFDTVIINIPEIKEK